MCLTHVSDHKESMDPPSPQSVLSEVAAACTWTDTSMVSLSSAHGEPSGAGNSGSWTAEVISALSSGPGAFPTDSIPNRGQG